VRGVGEKTMNIPLVVNVVLLSVVIWLGVRGIRAMLKHAAGPKVRRLVLILAFAGPLSAILFWWAFVQTPTPYDLLLIPFAGALAVGVSVWVGRLQRKAREEESSRPPH
jgi:hypothetical protein